MLKVMLIDDEILALNLLQTILKEMEHIEIVGVFDDPTEGLKQIELLNPDILFLDIEMTELNGIHLAGKLENSIMKPDIVFVTAYDQYALEAFNVEAADYILKPIEKERLKKTVERIVKRRNPTIKEPKQMGKIRAQLLGSFQLIDHKSEWIKWRTKKVKELTAYFIHHNGPIHRDKIMEDLWPDTPIDKAAALLHTTVYQLRKKLRDYGFQEPVVYKGEEYVFTIEVESDVKYLQSHIANGNVNEIINLYRADYLSQEDYVWAQQDCEKLQKQVVSRLERYVFDSLIEEKTYYKQVLDKLYEMNPWEEQYILKLVEFYIHQGNYKLAHQIIHSYEVTVQQELGIQPRQDFLAMLKEMVS